MNVSWSEAMITPMGVIQRDLEYNKIEHDVEEQQKAIKSQSNSNA